MESCIFCKIIKGELPATKVYEDDEVFGFLDINPVNHGHVLVIPKIHYPLMTDAPDEVVADMFVKSKQLMLAVKKAMNADYVVISVVGVDVPHFHIHLVPRFHNDGLAGFWPTKKYSEKEMEAAAEKIKNAL